MTDDHLVLVDDDGAPVGTMSKLEAHRAPGVLHLAVSVFVYDGFGRMLLQRRSDDKYHFSGLWANTCCTHPRPGEDPAAAAGRRLEEEMGISAAVEPYGVLRYEAADPASGLVEKEHDLLFTASFDGVPSPDPTEVGVWRWLELAALRQELSDQPERFVPWFSLASEEHPGLFNAGPPVVRA